MKTGLVAVGAAALLLLGWLAYWNTQPVRSSAPEFRAPVESPLPGSPTVDLEPPEALPEPGPAATPRAEVELPPAPEPKLVYDMADWIAFAKKYEGVDAAGRVAAMEAIRLRLRTGRPDVDESVKLRGELEWLALHENP